MPNELAIYRTNRSTGPYTLSSELLSIYDYMKHNVISCIENKEQLIERTRELYFELYAQMNSGFVGIDSIYLSSMPDAKTIADSIDGENMNAIYLACSESGFSDEEIDTIQIVYCHEIGCMLDDAVEQILWAVGYAQAPVKTPDLRLLEQVAFVSPDQIVFPWSEVWKNG